MNEKDCLMLQYIYEEQNITKAAERLYITQPAGGLDGLGTNGDVECCRWFISN